MRAALHHRLRSLYVEYGLFPRSADTGFADRCEAGIDTVNSITDQLKHEVAGSKSVGCTPIRVEPGIARDDVLRRMKAE